MQKIERDPGAALRSRIDIHRYGDHAKGDRCRCDGACHVDPFWGLVLSWVILTVRKKLPECAVEVRLELDDILPNVALLPQAFEHVPHPEVHRVRVGQLVPGDG